MSIAPGTDDSLGRRIAKAIAEALEVRKGQELTAPLIVERSNNAACYVLEVIAEYALESSPAVAPARSRYGFGDSATGVGDGLIDPYDKPNKGG